MFPIISTAKNDAVILNDRKYLLGSHGLSRALPWIIKESGNDYIILVQEYGGSVIENPRQGKLPGVMSFLPYTLEQTIIVRPNELLTDVVLKNTSERVIKYNLGMHPAFKVIGARDKIDFESDTRQERTSLKELVDSERAIFYHGATEMTYHHEKGLLIMGTKGFGEMMLWTSHDDLENATMFCIEPVTNIPDQKNKKYWSPGQRCEIIKQNQNRNYSMNIKIAQFRGT